MRLAKNYSMLYVYPTVVKAICFPVVFITIFITLAHSSHFAEWSVAVSQSFTTEFILCFLSEDVNTLIVPAQVQ